MGPAAQPNGSGSCSQLLPVCHAFLPDSQPRSWRRLLPPMPPGPRLLRRGLGDFGEQCWEPAMAGKVARTREKFLGLLKLPLSLSELPVFLFRNRGSSLTLH